MVRFFVSWDTADPKRGEASPDRLFVRAAARNILVPLCSTVASRPLDLRRSFFLREYMIPHMPPEAEDMMRLSDGGYLTVRQRGLDSTSLHFGISEL